VTFARTANAARYAVTEIQHSLGHTKVTTTQEYLKHHTDPLTVAGSLLEGISREG
jgi:integrase